MVFSSVTFLTLFLPITLLVYYLLPHAARNAWLLLASLAFYAVGEPVLVLLFVAEILWNWAFGLAIDKRRDTRSAKALLALCLAGDLGVLAVFKYLGFFARIAETLSGATLAVPELALPIGISFYTFQEVSYVVDVYRGASPQRNPLATGLYLALFPQLIAGPIVRYTDIEPQLGRRDVTLDDVTDGFFRFARGLCKKVLVANQLAELTDVVLDPSAVVEMPAPLVWLAALSFALQLFFDFSGYSAMAIGLGRMFGFTLPENFRDPYCAATATEFWRRWHISLSSWFRDYVYIPLGGSRAGDAATLRNLAIVWTLTGLWHGADWAFVLWGIGWGCLIALERFVVRPDSRGRGFRVVWRIIVLLCALILWVPFQAGDLESAALVLAQMFSPAAWALAGERATWIVMWLHDKWPCLLAGLVMAAGVPGAVARRIPQEGTAHDVVETVCSVVLVALSALAFSFVVQGAYNPFLYFQF